MCNNAVVRKVERQINVLHALACEKKLRHHRPGRQVGTRRNPSTSCLIYDDAADHTVAGRARSSAEGRTRLRAFVCTSKLHHNRQS